ncbi:MAG: FAD-dependent oxidoreductase, partial [Muribaculaceae bacterium]|nr:FAD-dependent oxidoreductase [Muribaculaceae bacterium]
MKHLYNAYIKTYLLSLVLIIISAGNAICQNSIDTDVLIIGGGASGTAAGVQAARMGAQTIIIEESPWVGGMLTAAGVSAIDGNHKLPAGMWGEFRDALIKHYGSAEALQTGWVSNVQFEPSVGNKIFQELISAEKNLRLFTQTKLSSLRYNKGKWNANVANNNTGEFFSINASIVIDATELGDIAKMTGVKYDIGMESRHDTREDIAPENSNGIIQDLTYVAVLKDYGKDVTINRPDGYDASNYACCSINELCTSPSEPDRMWSPEMMITYGKLPGNKYMINWPIEGNDFYLNIIEASPQEREKALTEAKNFTLGFIYFMQTELGFNTLGLADDEFPTDDLLPFMPYHRESRRIHGLTRFTLNHIVAPYDQAEALYRTSIAVGDYPVDHHHARYTGQEELPRLYFHPVPSFGLHLGTLIPQNVDNLIVAEKSISVSNIVNGTTRLQPVVLQIGTAAGTLAALAASQGKSPADVSVREVQRNILDAGGYLLPFLDVDKNDDRFKSYQRIGATGILKGEGRN